MGYLVCEKCGGYYKLQTGEKADDFDLCQCGGKLKYYKHIYDYIGTDDLLKEPDHQEDAMADLGLYQKKYADLQDKEIQYSNPQKYLRNNAITIFIFSISFFAYGIAYGDLYLNMAGLCIILFASGLYLSSKKEIIEFDSIKRIYLLGSYFFAIAGVIAIFFTLNNFEELSKSYFNGGKLVVISTIVLISFYLGIMNYNSHKNPEKQYDPMEYTKESIFLGMFDRGSYSLFRLVLIVVFCAFVVFIIEMLF